MNALGIAGEEIDIRPAREADARRHGPPVRRGRAGLRRHLRERAGGPAHRLSVPPRQPARRLRHRHRRPVRDRARLVDLRRRRPDEPLRRQCRRAQDADPVSDPLGDQNGPVRRGRPTRSCRRSSTPRSRPSWSRPTPRAACKRPRSGSAPTSCTISSSTTSCATASRRRRSPSSPGRPGRTPRRAAGRSTIPRRSSANTTSPRSANGSRSSCFRFFQLSQFKRSRHPQRAQGLGRRRALPARRLARAERRQCGAVAGGTEGGVRGRKRPCAVADGARRSPAPRWRTSPRTAPEDGARSPARGGHGAHAQAEARPSRSWARYAERGRRRRRLALVSRAAAVPQQAYTGVTDSDTGDVRDRPATASAPAARYTDSDTGPNRDAPIPRARPGRDAAKAAFRAPAAMAGPLGLLGFGWRAGLRPGGRGVRCNGQTPPRRYPPGHTRHCTDSDRGSGADPVQQGRRC